MTLTNSAQEWAVCKRRDLKNNTWVRGMSYEHRVVYDHPAGPA